jgi:hypothetical protein
VASVNAAYPDRIAIKRCQSRKILGPQQLPAHFDGFASLMSLLELSFEGPASDESVRLLPTTLPLSAFGILGMLGIFGILGLGILGILVTKSGSQVLQTVITCLNLGGV